MLSYTGNDSSTNTTELDKTATIIQSWISVLLIVAGLFLNILVLIALAKSSNEMFNKSVRLILSNILIGCVLIGVSGLMMRSMTLICGYFNLPPSIGVCKAFMGFYLIGGGIRFAFMATNAIIVFLLVRRLKNMAKIWKISVAITVILWLLISTLCLISVVSENVIAISFVQDIACYPYLQRNSTAYTFLAIIIMLFPVVTYIIVITVPILTLFYIRQHNISGDVGPQKGLIKFTFFLIIGTTLNLLSQLGPIIQVAQKHLENTKDDEGKVVSILYYQAMLSYISLLPTPIMIILYFKFIRRQIYLMLNVKTCKERP